jgi:hypothetical protein
MADEQQPRRPISRKELLHWATREMLPAAAASGIGYGIGRTAAERLLSNDEFVSKYGPGIAKYGPTVLGVSSALAGQQLLSRVHKRWKEPATEEFREEDAP